MVGSEVAKHIFLNSWATLGRYRFFNASLSDSNTGSMPSELSKSEVAVPAHAAAISSTTRVASNNPNPWPPYSFGMSMLMMPSSYAF